MNKVIERLRSECILNAEEDSGFSRDVLWLCNEAEDMSAELDIAKQRIEHLEAALRDIYTWNATGDYERDLFRMKGFALVALEDGE